MMVKKSAPASRGRFHFLNQKLMMVMAFIAMVMTCIAFPMVAIPGIMAVADNLLIMTAAVI